VILSRKFKGLTPDHFTFNILQTAIPFINAIGSTKTFSYHKFKMSSILNLVALDGSTCICKGSEKDYINDIAFEKFCAPPPTGDLLQQKNPTCSLATYSGGLCCCRHGMILLDADQPVDNRVDEVYLKFRFYYQKYEPAISPSVGPSHKNLHRFYFTTEAFAGEYDIVKCPHGHPPSECIQEITSHFTPRQWLDCDPYKDPVNCNVKNGMQLIYGSGHCHAPSCLSMELYNADTGALLCRQVPVYGTGSSVPFDEYGYAAIPPCLWGYEDGLSEPPVLFVDTNLFSIKRSNNTFGHLGDMAQWQMRGVFL